MKKIISLGILFLLLILPVLAHEGADDDHGGMMPMHNSMSMYSWFGMGFLGMGFFMLFCFLFWILVIALIVWIIYKLVDRGENVRVHKKKKQ